MPFISPHPHRPTAHLQTPLSPCPQANRSSTNLNHPRPNLLPRLPQPNTHIPQQRRMPDITRVAVTVDVACPLVFCGVGVASADVAGLELL